MAEYLLIKVVGFVAILYLLGSLGTSIYAFTSPIWIEYTVKDSDSYTFGGMEYYSRTRGMMFECPLNGDAQALKNRDKFPDVYSNCSYLNLEDKVNSSASYNFIINLRRAHIGVFWAAIAIVLLSTIYYLIILLYFQTKIRTIEVGFLLKHQIIAASLVFFAVTTFFISFVVFHILMDQEKITNAPELPAIYYNWPGNIKSSTTIKYGVCYWMAWVSTGLAVIACLFLYCAVICCFNHKTSDETQRIKIEYDNTGFYNTPHKENHYDEVVGKHSGSRSNSFNLGHSNSHLAGENDEKVLIPVFYDNAYNTSHGGPAHMKPDRKPDAFYAISSSGGDNGIHIGRPGSTSNSIY